MDSSITKNTFSLFFLAITSKAKDSKQVGTNIGRRLCEDYFFQIKATNKIKTTQVGDNIALFFKTYVSYTPRIEHNLILLDDFWALKHSPHGLSLFQGVFEEVYKFYCENKVEFEVDEDRKLLLVKY